MKKIFAIAAFSVLFAHFATANHHCDKLKKKFATEAAALSHMDKKCKDPKHAHKKKCQDKAKHIAECYKK